MDGYYTLASWYIHEGQEAEFLRVWKEELASAFLGLDSSANGTLIQSLDDPRLFYSFGPWDSLEKMRMVRADPHVGDAISKLVSLCEDAKPGPFRVVLRIPE